MKKVNTEAVVRNSFKKLSCRIRVLIRNTSSNLVHDFRTEVKKLKAILNLFSTELKDPEDLKLPRRLKDIYRAAGSIRELQLQLSQTKGYKEYSALLTEVQTDREEHFRRIAQKKTIKKTRQRIMERLPGQLHQHTITLCRENKLKEIETIRALPQPSDDQMHTIRKNLKDIIYVQKIGDEKSIENPAVKEMKQATKELGKLNDLRTSIKYLRPVWINEIGYVERRKLIRLRTARTRRKDALKKRIISEYPGFQFTQVSEK